MVAAVLHGAKDVRLEEMPIPQLGPEDLLARVEAASPDFTDRKVYLRGSHPMITIPGLFGHEWAGVVVARGGRLIPGGSLECGLSQPILRLAPIRIQRPVAVLAGVLARVCASGSCTTTAPSLLTFVSLDGLRR